MWTDTQLDRLLKETEDIKHDPEAERFAQACRSLVAEVRRLRESLRPVDPNDSGVNWDRGMLGH